MSKKIMALLAAAMMFCFVSLPVAADHHEPKYKTKDIMKKAMKGGLLKKVQNGQASDDEKKTLHEMLVALGKNKPPRGEADSWKKLTDALAKAGKAAVDGADDAGTQFKDAAKCAACHKLHKPKK